MLAEYLKPDQIVVNEGAPTYRDMLRKMVERSTEPDPAATVEGIIAREKIMPTALGKGICMPRVVVEGKERTEVIVAVNREGMLFDDCGTKPANIIALFIFSGNDDRAGLLAQGLRLFNDDNLRAALLQCTKGNEIVRAVRAWEKG